LCSQCCSSARSRSRENINFNRDWKFKLGDYPGAEAPTYKDSDWSAIGLPHSFSIPYFLSKDFYIGYGWYRKSFDCKPEWANKRIFLQFEAAFQDAEVYVNGSRIGEHKGGVYRLFDGYHRRRKTPVPT
jgi:beta-galactosidase/beta-glucuronidase